MTHFSLDNHVVRVEVQPGKLIIELANAKGSDRKRTRKSNLIEVPWHKTPSTRRREVLVPESALLKISALSGRRTAPPSSRRLRGRAVGSMN